MEQIFKRLDQIERLILEQNMLQKEMLTLKEAASYINVSKGHMYKLTHWKEISHYCPNGKLLYFKKLELDQWMQRTRKISRYELETEAAKYSFNNGRV